MHAAFVFIDCIMTIRGKWQYLYTIPFFIQCLQLQQREREAERERRQWEQGEKEGTVFLTHTALSFCSVTPLRSAGPPFSQSWNSAKKALSYRLYIHHRCFDSMHVSFKWINKTREVNTACVHYPYAAVLKVLICKVSKYKPPKQCSRARQEREKRGDRKREEGGEIPVERCLPTILLRARFCATQRPSLSQYVCSARQASEAHFWSAAKKLHSSCTAWDNPPPPPFLPPSPLMLCPSHQHCFGWASPLLSIASLCLYLYRALFLSWRWIFSLSLFLSLSLW